MIINGRLDKYAKYLIFYYKLTEKDILIKKMQKNVIKNIYPYKSIIRLKVKNLISRF